MTDTPAEQILKERGYDGKLCGHQLSLVIGFIQQLAYFRGLRRGLKGHSLYQGFWTMTGNNHLKQGIIDWCKVFGSRKEQTYWEKTAIANWRVRRVKTS